MQRQRGPARMGGTPCCFGRFHVEKCTMVICGLIIADATLSLFFGIAMTLAVKDKTWLLTIGHFLFKLAFAGLSVLGNLRRQAVLLVPIAVYLVLEVLGMAVLTFLLILARHNVVLQAEFLAVFVNEKPRSTTTVQPNSYNTTTTTVSSTTKDETVLKFLQQAASVRDDDGTLSVSSIIGYIVAIIICSVYLLFYIICIVSIGKAILHFRRGAVPLPKIPKRPSATYPREPMHPEPGSISYSDEHYERPGRVTVKQYVKGKGRVMAKQHIRVVPGESRYDPRQHPAQLKSSGGVKQKLAQNVKANTKTISKRLRPGARKPVDADRSRDSTTDSSYTSTR